MFDGHRARPSVLDGVYRITVLVIYIGTLHPLSMCLIGMPVLVETLE